jgi:hypothetical protein
MRPFLALALADCLLLLGCHPDLPEGGSGHGGDATGEPPAVAVELEPADAPEAAARAVRFHVTVPAPTVAPAPEQFVVATGELGPAHLRQLADGDLSNALTERLLPVRSWADEIEGAVVVHVAPAVLLEPGETYTLAAGEPEVSLVIEVADEGSRPLLSRRWPPAGASETADVAIWCGDEALGEVALAVQLAPFGPVGTLHAGVAPGVGSKCLRFDAELAASGEAAQEVPFEDAPIASGWLPPPLVEVAGRPMLLDPAPLAADVAATEPSPPPVCDAAAPLRFGPGCATLLDDRLMVRAPDARSLWAVAGEGLDQVLDVAAGAPLVLAPLTPSSSISLQVITIDAAGRATHDLFEGFTAAPMPHLVLNEVLANPLGVEPQQEWVELYNSGVAAAELAGYTFEDVGGVAVLPAGTLPPGGYALLVGEGFAEDDLIDPPVPPGAMVVRVGKLAKNGLSNSGEPLTLRDAEGAVVSRFPPLPKPKPGESVARIEPLAPDELPSSFTHKVPTPAAAN